MNSSRAIPKLCPNLIVPLSHSSRVCRQPVRLAVWALLLAGTLSIPDGAAGSAERLVIIASPSLRAAVTTLARAFESAHPGLAVTISFEPALEMRRTIARMENQGGGARERGPIHIVAPGGDELISRLAQKRYILEETRTVYATRPLVLVVPESLVDAPASLEAALGDPRWRVAVADPAITPLGQETRDALASMGLAQAARLDVAIDSRSVLDHVLRGEADAGIVFGPEAAEERERVRVAAVAPAEHHRPRVFSMAAERQCPDRARCDEFLTFARSSTAQALLRQLGYGLPQ
jgi:molybdate transport system substrate-binding protein